MSAMLCCALAFGAPSVVPPPRGAAATGAAARMSPKPPPAGHSHQGEAFDEGPRQAAALRPGQGAVAFRPSAKNPQAAAFVEQGVAQLHGFLHFEAERSFRTAAALEPDHPMPYWGMALANVNNETRARAFLKAADARKARATPREALHLEAARARFKEGPLKERLRGSAKALEDLVGKFPDDLEARAFLALAMWDATKEGDRQSPAATDSVAAPILAAVPRHPVHHYLIHTWDTDGRADRALRSAAECGPGAPGIAHMWHMPAHLYSKLHRYRDAAWQFEASARVDHDGMRRGRVMPYEIHNYAHNNEWWSRDLAALGRGREALAAARNLLAEPRHPKRNPADGGGAAGLGFERFRDACLAFEYWSDLRNAAARGLFDRPAGGVREFRWLHATGLAEAAAGAIGAAFGKAEELAYALDAHETALAEAEANAKSPPPGKPPAAPAGKLADGDATELRELLAELRGALALAAGDPESAAADFAAAPAARRVRWLLAAGATGPALKLARERVKEDDPVALPLAELVRARDAAGNPEEAKRAFARLRMVAGDADLDLPALRRLAPLARRLGWPDDWRTPAAPAKDLGYRPALATLGPRDFEPWTMPAWSRPADDGRTVGSAPAQARGQATLVLFYMGGKCRHCVEQLRAFEPQAAAFARLGVEAVAVSTETPDRLPASRAALGAAARLRIPLVADPQLALFRSYGAYDDFEKVPLHGAFLLDSFGRVLWRDVGPEPFADASFLLAESARLLRLSRLAPPPRPAQSGASAR